MDVHDLTAAYAVDALDAEERERYESHLAQCDRCRDELAALAPAVAALPYAVDAAMPPPALRERILSAARDDNVVPLRRRPWPAVAVAASLAAVAAAVWAISLSHSLSKTRDERDAAAAAARVLAAPASTHRLVGASGVVSVDRSGRAVLIVDRLPPAPRGKTYEAWVIRKGAAPVAAGTFAGGGNVVVVPLRVQVPSGAVVAATVERSGGVDAPTTKPFVTSTT